MIKHNTQHGFTLMELMIVVGVIAILATMAAPTMIDTVRRSHLNNEIKDVFLCMKEARANAVLHRKQSNDILQFGKGCQANTNAHGNAKKPDLLKHTVFSEPQTLPVNLSFDHMGRLKVGNALATSDLCFVLQHENDAGLKSAIRLSTTGRAEMLKGQADCT